MSRRTNANEDTCMPWKSNLKSNGNDRRRARTHTSSDRTAQPTRRASTNSDRRGGTCCTNCQQRELRAEDTNSIEATPSAEHPTTTPSSRMYLPTCNQRLIQLSKTIKTRQHDNTKQSHAHPKKAVPNTRGRKEEPLNGLNLRQVLAPVCRS